MTHLDKYCAVPLDMWSASGSGMRVYSKLTKRIHTLSADHFQLLRQAPLEHLRSLDEHVEALVRGMRQVPGAPVNLATASDILRTGLRGVLRDLVENGLLVSQKTLQCL